MTYTKVNVTKPGNNKGVGGDKKDKITIFDVDDIMTMPDRDEKGIVITDNIVLKPGAYAIQIYATQSSIKAGADSEGEQDAKGITQSVEFAHPGDSVEIREFRANYMNSNVLILIERCSSNKKNLYGTPCAPLQMVFKAEDDKDQNKTGFTFKSSQKGPDVADYRGTITYETVKGTNGAASDTVDVAAGEGRYQLTTGVSASVDIVGLANAVDGGVYTLLGSGGAHPPAIPDSGEMMVMHNGSTWTGLAGAEITFKAFKHSGSDWKFIEQSRK